MPKAVLKEYVAPPLNYRMKWLEGMAIEAFTPGWVYVVFQFCTWCIPNRQAIPYIINLAKLFPNVLFIACSDESEAAIRASPLVMTMKGYPNISIAQGSAFYDDIVKPFWVNSVPVAFLIDKLGVVSWHGHPVDKTFQVEMKHEDDRVVDLRRSVLTGSSTQSKEGSGTVKEGNSIVSEKGSKESVKEKGSKESVKEKGSKESVKA